jgi:hypothetical protein
MAGTSAGVAERIHISVNAWGQLRNTLHRTIDFEKPMSVM